MRIRRLDSRVAVWDPNGVNPYGKELQCLLADSGRDVSIWLPARSTPIPVHEKSERRLLGDSRNTDGLFEHLIRRVFAPLLFCLVSGLHRDQVVLVWVRGTFEAALFGLAGRMRILKSLIFLDHNPIPGRDSGSSSVRVMSFLRYSSSAIVVHSETLARTEDLQIQERTVVVPHLRYAKWVVEYSIDKERAERLVKRAEDETLVDVLLVGALRPDKGWDRMEQLVDGLGADWCRILIYGTGAMPSRVATALSDGEFSTDLCVSRTPLTNREIASGLSKADVVLAPYPLATASGTVMLAISADVPVLGFESPGISDLLSPHSTVPNGEFAELAGLVEKWAETRFETYLLEAEEYDQKVVRGWSKVLGEKR